jgi:hypothetical protein
MLNDTTKLHTHMKIQYLLAAGCWLLAVAALAQPQERLTSAQEQPETDLSGKAQKATQALRKNPLYDKVQIVRIGAMNKVQKKGRFMLVLKHR